MSSVPIPSSSVPREEKIAMAGITDVAAPVDALGFKPYVLAIADFLTSKATKPPLTLSIEGEWGSGKSSFLLQLQERLRELGQDVISFNAWRHDKEDALWAAFALELTRQLASGLSLPTRIFKHMALAFRRFDVSAGWLDICRIIGLVALWITVTSSLINYAAHRDLQPIRDAISWKADGHKAEAKQKNTGSEQTPKQGSSEDDRDHLITLLLAIGGVSASLTMGVVLVKRLASLLGNPLAIDIRKYLENPDYDGHISFIENFHKDFGRILRTYVPNKTLYIFIDDLDRCDVPKAADLVQAINLLMGGEWRQLVFVLAMDREKIAAGIAAKYEKLLPYLEPGNEQREKGLEYGYTFVEKFIQLPFQVPQPTAADIDRWLDRLNDISPRPESEPLPTRPDLIQVVDGQDSERFRNIVKMVSFALDNNPRRLKQFVNVFRLRVHLASRTGLFAASDDAATSLTLEQLGKFVAIILRWPWFLRDLENHRKLLNALCEIGNSPAMTSRDMPSDIKHWVDEPRFLDLLKFGIDGKERRRFSLEGIDIDKLLRISPARITASTVRASPPQRSPEATPRDRQSESRSFESVRASKPSAPGSDAGPSRPQTNKRPSKQQPLR